ncbi:hypothetical protein [Mucilaginibacter pedocola]|uniref:Beta-lactamase-inhibitor-like PepSY-like domain-containing protein n=1 Tax=Mucilaginibacter pedocola TaxID=1792845 RepID=A0A1S9PJ46_9SPHI|nr:hypothetical protein [Mucilaginibacter pedocola]OOQ60991.1 hypothetical protein BC343_21300 [Mucilaginibacter pedocola]
MKTACLTLLIALLGLNALAQDSLEIKYPKTYKAVYKTVHALPEVKDFLTSAKNSKPVAAINGPNNSWHNYWEVQVGLSNLDMLRTNFHLFVNPKTLRVYYLDEYDDGNGLNFKLITLQQWRKWRSTKAWQKMHKYKNGELVTDTN